MSTMYFGKIFEFEEHLLQIGFQIFFQYCKPPTMGFKFPIVGFPPTIPPTKF